MCFSALLFWSTSNSPLCANPLQIYDCSLPVMCSQWMETPPPYPQRFHFFGIRRGNPLWLPFWVLPSFLYDHIILCDHIIFVRPQGKSSLSRLWGRLKKTIAHNFLERFRDYHEDIRAFTGARYFARTRSFVSTAQKQHISILDALKDLFGDNQIQLAGRGC